MARGRMINQTIDFDAEFNALSVEAQLMYLRTLAFLDRDGLIIGHPRALASKVAPLLECLQPQMSDIIDEWEDQGLVIRYSSKKIEVLFFKGFGKNQSGMHYDRETPSRFDPPPGWAYGPKGLVPIESAAKPDVPAEEVPIESEPTPTEPESNAQSESGDSPDEVPQESGDAPEMVGNESAPIEVKDQVKDQIQELQGDEEEDAQARDPIHVVWFETYQEEMPPKIKKAVPALIAECGEAAVIHGIRESIHADSRSFKFIASCARNYIPPAPEHHTNGYAVELPGGYKLQPPEQPLPAAPLPPPIPLDDPWSAALAELNPNLPGVAQSYLTGSRMEAAGDIEGIPLYRIIVEERAAAGVDWLNKQVSTNIRRTLGSILRQKIVVEIVAEQEAVRA